MGLSLLLRRLNPGLGHYASSAFMKRQISSRDEMTNQRNFLTLAALCVGAGCMMALPLVVQQVQSSNSMISKEGELTGSQIQRGPYINSGSKGFLPLDSLGFHFLITTYLLYPDAGRDRDWDLKTRTWEGRRN